MWTHPKLNNLGMNYYNIYFCTKDRSKEEQIH